MEPSLDRLSHSGLIDALGNGTKIAAEFEKLGVDLDPVKFRERVYKWKGANFIPWEWRSLFDVLARRQGIDMGDTFRFSIQHKNDAA